MPDVVHKNAKQDYISITINQKYYSGLYANKNPSFNSKIQPKHQYMTDKLSCHKNVSKLHSDQEQLI